MRSGWYGNPETSASVAGPTLRVVTLLAALLACAGCLKKVKDTNPPESAAKMVFESSPKCVSALTKPEEFAALSPQPAKDLQVISRFCGADAGPEAPQLGDVAWRKALCQRAQSRMNFKDEKTASRWAFHSTAPLNMSCDSFQKGGAAYYGSLAYLQEMRTFLLAADKSVEAPSQDHAPCSFQAPTRDIDFLKWINSELPLMVKLDTKSMTLDQRIEAFDKAFDIRGAQSALRTTGVMQAIPMTADEIAFLKKEWPNGEMTTTYIKDFFSHDVTPPAEVTGTVALHAQPDKLCGLLETWQKEATQLDSLASRPESYIRGVARLTRACVAIHPFKDGNGRACGLWSVRALARAGLPHSLRWPHPDYSIPLEDYTARFEKGVADSARALENYK